MDQKGFQHRISNRAKGASQEKDLASLVLEKGNTEKEAKDQVERAQSGLGTTAHRVLDTKGSASYAGR